ncbi:MAG: TonB-dependent receptor, partial [Pseudomonadota bacterium]
MSTHPSLVRSLALACCLLPSAVVAQSPQVEEIIVTGRAQDFYLDEETTLGSKLDLDVLELPQSVQVLTQQLILDQAARDITDLYRSMPGVSEYSYSGVTIRGFRDSNNVFYDGVRGDPYSGFSVPQLFNVERVEVLRGPSSAVYGSGEPGGLINYVSKKPDFDDNIELAATTGNYGLYGGWVDARGGLTESVAYRLAGFYEEQNSFRNNVDEKNTEIAGGLLFQLSDETSLTTTFDYVDQKLSGHRLRGVLVEDNGDFIVDTEYNSNEVFDFQDLEAWVVQGILKHEFSENLNLSTTLRYLDNDRDQGYHEPQGWVDVNGDGEANSDDQFIRRQYRDQERSNKEYSLTVDLVQKFSLWGTDNQLLFGGDYHDIELDALSQFASFEASGVANLNVFDPNYGETNPDDYVFFTLPFDEVQSTRYGLYLHDFIQFNEHWSMLAGFRYDNYDDKEETTGFSFSDDNISPRVGLTYYPVPEGAVYLNYSESFVPAPLDDQQAVNEEDTLDPETGVQYELGWKQNWLEGALLSTVAIYQITKKDLVLANPNDTGPGDGNPQFVNLGKVESEGIELTLVGDITANWAVTANYAYNDVKVVEGSSVADTFEDGSRFVNAPEHQVGLWSRYEIGVLNSSVAGGLSYVSEQFSSAGQRVKPYTVFDASWVTLWKDFTFQVNISNLFDKTYAVSGFQERTGHFPGARREF